MSYRTISFAIEDRVATLRLNQPDVLNALSRQMVDELTDAVGRVEGNEEVKALVVRGEGRAFCAGADLLFFEGAFQEPATLHDYLKRLNALFFRLEELPLPVIAVVHGFVLAGGLELMLACDMAIAAEGARIGDQHANVGLMPGGGSTQRLTRRLGSQRALELMFTGRWLSGTEAQECGLVLRAVPAEKLENEVEKLLAMLRNKSRASLGWIKRTVVRGRDIPLREGIDLETLSFTQFVASSPHPREGIQAFKEKREPVF